MAVGVDATANGTLHALALDAADFQLPLEVELELEETEVQFEVTDNLLFLNSAG